MMLLLKISDLFEAYAEWAEGLPEVPSAIAYLAPIAVLILIAGFVEGTAPGTGWMY